MIIQCAHCVVVLAQLVGGLEEDAADGDVVFFGEFDPNGAHGRGGVCVVCDREEVRRGRQVERREGIGWMDVPIATDLPACRCSSATFTQRSRCVNVSFDGVERVGMDIHFSGYPG